jgi:dipeptidyl aminopeptidase/acylaminoacyl peptidase
MIPRWLLATVITVSLVGVGHAFAQLPPLIPSEVLFGNPERVDPKISPDGKYLAYRAPDENNVLQLWVRTVGQQDDRKLTAEKKRGIPFHGWPYDGEHLVYGQDAEGDENWHLYTVNLKSGIVRDLTPFQGIQARFVASDPDFPNEMLVALNLKDRRS